jgi:membrane-bound lytic murein transglycosylase B
VRPKPGGGAAPAPARKPTKYELLGAAYTHAAESLSDGCHLPFALLLAIGEVESSSLRGRRLDAGGNVVPPVLGPVLAGGGFAAIKDTDGGRLDGDPTWDRAVGPMQFIPGTWRLWGADANGDGVADPQNVEDAALSAGRYLCAGGRDLSKRADLEAAILSYNHSRRYLRTVLGIQDSVTRGLVAGP